MLWGCFGWDGVEYACKIDGNMDSNLYVSILEDELQKSLQYWGKNAEEVVFQQDNDPKHTSIKAKTWLEDPGFDVMVWSPQSPDLNPIEHLWGQLKRKLGEYEEPPASIQELWTRVQKEWDDIGEQECRNVWVLCCKMPASKLLQCFLHKDWSISPSNLMLISRFMPGWKP